jgi:hypothetical protein
LLLSKKHFSLPIEPLSSWLLLDFFFFDCTVFSGALHGYFQPTSRETINQILKKKIRKHELLKSNGKSSRVFKQGLCWYSRQNLCGQKLCPKMIWQYYLYTYIGIHMKLLRNKIALYFLNILVRFHGINQSQKSINNRDIFFF